MKDQNKIDEKIIKLFSEGKGISEVSANLKLLKVHPYSVGSIQKRMAVLRKKYEAKTDFQLIKEVENARWLDQFERMMKISMKEGFDDGMKKGIRNTMLITIPGTMALCFLIYLLIT